MDQIGKKDFFRGNILLVIAFIEGACLMAIEFTGAKILGSIYGASLQIWTLIFGATLGGVALGYFLGGVIIHKYKKVDHLFYILITGSVFSLLMPLIAQNTLMTANVDNLLFSALISSLKIIFIPVICMGCISPIIIQTITRKVEVTGKSAGRVYGISTLGGIIATFFYGFYLLPTWGITTGILVTSITLGIFPVIYFAKKSKFSHVLIYVLCFVLIGYGTLKDKFSPLKTKNNKRCSVEYFSEGLLGQIKVIDHLEPAPWITNSNEPVFLRRLLINNILQSFVMKDFKRVSLFPYIHRIAAYAGIKPPGSNALILGFGSGNMVTELAGMGFKIDAVDIDERMFKVAKDLFDYDKAQVKNTFIDDARHYINTTSQKYDLITIDLLTGEIQPSQVFSVECFGKIKEMLNVGGIIIVNCQGNLLDHNKSIVARSIYRTFKETGFNVKYWHSDNSADNVGDILFVASLSSLDYAELSKERLNKCCRQNLNLNELFIKDEITVNDAYILSDNKPILEMLDFQTKAKWRQKALVSMFKLSEHYELLLFK